MDTLSSQPLDLPFFYLLRPLSASRISPHTLPGLGLHDHSQPLRPRRSFSNRCRRAPRNPAIHSGFLRLPLPDPACATTCLKQPAAVRTLPRSTFPATPFPPLPTHPLRIPDTP